jgi:hypothetical protein
VRKALIPVPLLFAASPAHCQDDLTVLWNLAVANNLALREAAAIKLPNLWSAMLSGNRR